MKSALLPVALLFISLPVFAQDDGGRQYRIDFAIITVLSYLMVASAAGLAVWLMARKKKNRYYRD